jgi:outer membrane protein OmpA-like peptidoglycan-associated protein
MFRKNCVLVALLALGVVTAANAQQKGQFQIGVGAGMPFYADTLALDNPIGFGGRLGYMFSDKIGLEGDLFYYSTTPANSSIDVTEMPIHGRLTYYADLSRNVGFIFGLGAVYNAWGGDSLESYYGPGITDSDAGPGGLIGVRFGGGKVSLRVDLTGDYIINPFNETSADNDSRFDLGMDAMLSFAFGGKPGTPKDSDKDGVPDKAPDLCPNTPLGTAVDANGCPYGDADKDGVTDNLDKCPNTPMGATVDAMGCPSDSDKDGVYSGIDQCPNTPMGATVDAKGCPMDSDSDGVYNGIDQCPDTPAGAKVDAKGCPMDADGDGVADYLDKCPNTPAGVKVDTQGCPILFEAGKSALVLEGVTFATNSATLDPSSTEILDRLANALQNAQSGAKLEVAGYTDNTGARAHNMRLSQARAESVMKYLVSHGVPASMMVAKGYGPDFPIDTNATAAGRANNRRVMLKQIK